MTSQTALSTKYCLWTINERRLCKALITEGKGEFKMVEPNTDELLIGKMVLIEGRIELAEINSTVSETTKTNFVKSLNDWYARYRKMMSAHENKLAS